jgi:hypothetical protein
MKISTTGPPDCPDVVQKLVEATSSVAPFRRTASVSFTVFSERVRRRFFRSAGRHLTVSTPTLGSGAPSNFVDEMAKIEVVSANV